MLFNYKSIDQQGVERNGVIDAVNVDVAILSLQRRGLVITNIRSADKIKSIFNVNIDFFDRVDQKDVVILSRQMATLFAAQVSALRIFRLLAAESEKRIMQRILTAVADDLQSGDSISRALGKHPEAFSEFYVNMVRSGEESGKLDETFLYLADYLDRNYEITSKVRNALVYPAFIFLTFIGVMILMLTQVIPKIATIMKQSGQTLPVYTRIVLGISDFLLNYWFYILAILIIGIYLFIQFIHTERGRLWWDTFKVTVPLFGTAISKLYLSRIADNMSTMLGSGIPVARVIEITSHVVNNSLYALVLADANESIRGGSTIADAFSKHREIPGIMSQMIKVGEESGELGSILKTLAKFYNRDVTSTVDNLVSLIEPIMIIVLGVGVAILLASVLLPIYNFAGGLGG